jgi:hypothetical protein
MECKRSTHTKVTLKKLHCTLDSKKSGTRREAEGAETRANNATRSGRFNGQLTDNTAVVAAMMKPYTREEFV